MKNDTPIILDRLELALKSCGVSLKRNQLLGVAAEAFGYRNANAFSAAAKEGEFAPRAAEPVGADEFGLAIFRDPLTGSMFGMDIENPASRAQTWAVSPYGGIIDVSAIPAGAKIDNESVKVHVATISHKHGSNFYIDFTTKGLEKQIAEFCREYWSEAQSFDSSLPDDPGNMSSKEIVSTYFDVHPDEYVEYSTEGISFPRTVASKVPGPEWVIKTESPDGQTLWWNNEDGWGEFLSCATVFKDQAVNLPTAGMDSEVEWVELPRSENLSTMEASGNMTHEGVFLAQRQRDAAELLFASPIQIKDGLSFYLVKPVKGENQDELLLKTSGNYNPDVAREWLKAVKLQNRDAEMLKKQVRIEIQDEFTQVWIPDDLYIAIDHVHWRNAVKDLLLPPEGRERIEATFQPEVWINDHAVPCDPQGETVFDITYDMLLMGFDMTESLDAGNTDFLTDAVRAPKWISNWNGPFTIVIDNQGDWESKRHLFP